MKKLLVLFIMIVGFTVSFVGAAPLDYDFTITDNYTFDLESGVYSYDENYITTNRIKILDEEVGISTDTFHHVLFFGNNNEYIGYKNTVYSNIINEKYLGVVSGGSFTVPENATAFTLLSYKDANDAIIPEYGLSLNDIFGVNLHSQDGTNTNNLILNGDFSVDTNSDGIADNFAINGSITHTVSNNKQVFSNDTTTLYSGILQYGHTWFYEHQYYINLDYMFGVNTSYVLVLNNGIYQEPISLIENGLSQNLSLIFEYKSDNPSHAGLDYLKFQSYMTTESNDNYIADFVLLDLTTIFGDTVPDQTTMDTLLYQYKLNKDLNNAYAVDDISYKDIFGESIYGTEGTNLIENGAFSDTFESSLYFSQNSSLSIINDQFNIVGDGSSTYYRVAPKNLLMSENSYIYYTYDIVSISNNFVRSFIRDGSSGTVATIHDESTIGVVSYIDYVSFNSTSYHIIFDDNTSGTGIFILDNIQAYDLTTTFGDTVPSIATFEGYRDTFEANIILNNEYTNYFTVSSFSLIQPTYDYITPEADDTISTPDDMLDTVIDTVGGDSTLSQVIISITIMLVILVILASANANYLFIVGIEMVVYSALSILGWVPAWVNIIFGVILLLILVRTFTGKSGGQSDDNL